MNRLVHILYRIDIENVQNGVSNLYIMISPSIGEHPKDIMVGPLASGIRGKPHKSNGMPDIRWPVVKYLYKMY